MATKLEDITAVNWQLSDSRSGQVAQGIDDIKQCIKIILMTTKGSDPLRPLFGSDIWQHIDKPVKIAAALISAEIVTALTKWEPRVEVERIVYNIFDFKIDFSLYLKLSQETETLEVLFFIANASTPLEDGGSFSHGFDFGFN